MSKIKHLIFDLDDTLYPHSSRMSSQILRRIIEYSARFFNKSYDEILEIRKAELKKYVSTLWWLKSNGFKNDEEYFSYVHPAEEIKDLDFDPELRPFLESLPQPKVILTNSPSEHAEHVLEFLKVRDLFNKTISDIRRNDLRGKPFDISYRDALSIVGGSLKDTLFLDDYPYYIEGYAKLGGLCCLVGDAPYEIPQEYKNQIFRIKTIYELPSVLEKL